MTKANILIQHGAKIMAPPIVDGVTIDWEWKGQPGKLCFSVVKTDTLGFNEGDSVLFSFDGKKLFKGFVFEKSRTGLDKKIVQITCYDQIFYLVKNKDTYVIENKTAADFVRMVALDFGLKTGKITPTPYVMESRVEDNNGLLDSIENCIDLTKDATGMCYTLYDSVGFLTLSSDAEMMVSGMIDATNTANFDYKSSIHDDTYNRIKLIQEKKDSDSRQVFIAQDPAKMAKWGVLQYTEKLDGDETGGQAKAQAMLAQMNRKKRTLSVKDVIGNTAVRGGSLVPVMLGLGDMNLSAIMRVEQVQHTFRENQHTMSLRLSGGAFNE